MKSKKKVKAGLIVSGLIILLFINSGCNREQQVPIPYIYVNYTVYLNNPSNSHLRVPGSYLRINGQGNHGIFLYRKTLGETDDFIAFDRTCSYEPLGSCIVDVDETDFYLECPCCGSKFSVFDGFPTEGPAKWPLKQYQTNYNGSNLRIYN